MSEHGSGDGARDGKKDVGTSQGLGEPMQKLEPGSTLSRVVDGAKQIAANARQTAREFFQGVSDLEFPKGTSSEDKIERYLEECGNQVQKHSVDTGVFMENDDRFADLQEEFRKLRNNKIFYKGRVFDIEQLLNTAVIPAYRTADVQGFHIEKQINTIIVRQILQFIAESSRAKQPGIQEVLCAPMDRYLRIPTLYNSTKGFRRALETLYTHIFDKGSIEDFVCSVLKEVEKVIDSYYFVLFSDRVDAIGFYEVVFEPEILKERLETIQLVWCGAALQTVKSDRIPREKYENDLGVQGKILNMRSRSQGGIESLFSRGDFNGWVALKIWAHIRASWCSYSGKGEALMEIEATIKKGDVHAIEHALGVMYLRQEMQISLSDQTTPPYVLKELPELDVRILSSARNSFVLGKDLRRIRYFYSLGMEESAFVEWQFFIAEYSRQKQMRDDEERLGGLSLVSIEERIGALALTEDAIGGLSEVESNDNGGTGRE